MKYIIALLVLALLLSASAFAEAIYLHFANASQTKNFTVDLPPAP